MKCDGLTIGEKFMWKELLNLYWIFVKMGAVCFGGGYAMLPILERELVLKRGWVTKEEIIDYYALGQCTPGVIAVNTSTFVGNKLAGNFGWNYSYSWLYNTIYCNYNHYRNFT